MYSVDTQIYQKETADFINVTDKSARIYLCGSLSEKKEQLLKKLGIINEQYSGRKNKH